ncbi:HDOD domain-containing protein [Alteromonas sp. ASW11-36]|uniref:HDOD domain-containing protein n=1 Tax=Alteromonas arenosi TaxID=3055817 RepID=A0ABT7SVL1_9ALTE|nr:HDOD domain-containing protein [Alteromonas sp. ASW11-36]MDM7860232.1 HDOD domain-containing protein [Alteromonas sp. ASW11-36]
MTSVKHYLRFQSQYDTHTDPKAFITASLQCSQLLIKTFNKSPALTYIQLETLWQQKPSTQPLFNIGLLLLICRINQVSDTFVQHAVAGILIGNSIKGCSSESERHSSFKAVNRRINGQHFDTLRWSLIHSLRKDVSTSAQQCVAFDCVRLTGVVTQSLALMKHVSLPALAKAINQTILQYPQYQPLINPLFELGSDFLTGLVVKSANGTAFIVGHTPDSIALASLSKGDNSERLLTVEHMKAVELWPRLTLQRRMPPKVLLQVMALATPKQREHCNALGKPSQFSVQYPPNDLLMILDALNKPTIEPATLAQLIGKNTLFTTVLQRSATELNRLNINVSNIKQSIMTHGTERIAAVLTEHILWQRLSRSQFPLSKPFEQLCLLHRQVCASIAELCKLGIPQQFSLSALLQLSGLFTTSSLRLSHQWQMATTELGKVDTLTSEAAAIDFNQQAFALAKSWHQGREATAPFESSTGMAKSARIFNDVHAISLNLCRQWLQRGIYSESVIPAEIQQQCKRIQFQPAYVDILVERHCQAIYQPI